MVQRVDNDARRALNNCKYYYVTIYIISIIIDNYININKILISINNEINNVLKYVIIINVYNEFYITRTTT